MDTEQSTPPTGNQPAPLTLHKSSLKRRAVKILLVLLVVWFLLAYLVVPTLWKGYFHLRPKYDEIPEITFTSDGHPGDPLNVSLIGTEDQLNAIFKAAGWFPADPLGLRSDIHIAEATLLERQYEHAPVSRLFLRGPD